MKRSEINSLVNDAKACFLMHGWSLPSHPVWDVTDFGLGDWRKNGLVLVNLAEEPEYCEKLMYAKKGMVTPAHTHAKKKEDIICRSGGLAVRVWKGKPGQHDGETIELKMSRKPTNVISGEVVQLAAGERVTLTPGIYHEFWPTSEECIIGEVSTANDDANDNFFVDERIGRYPGIEEDEPADVRLISEL